MLLHYNHRCLHNAGLTANLRRAGLRRDYAEVLCISASLERSLLTPKDVVSVEAHTLEARFYSGELKLEGACDGLRRCTLQAVEIGPDYGSEIALREIALYCRHRRDLIELKMREMLCICAGSAVGGVYLAIAQALVSHYSTDAFNARRALDFFELALALARYTNVPCLCESAARCVAAGYHSSGQPDKAVQILRSINLPVDTVSIEDLLIVPFIE